MCECMYTLSAMSGEVMNYLCTAVQENCLQNVPMHTFVLTTAIYESILFILLFIGLFILYNLSSVFNCNAAGSRIEVGIAANIFPILNISHVPCLFIRWVDIVLKISQWVNSSLVCVADALTVSR